MDTKLGASKLLYYQWLLLQYETVTEQEAIHKIPQVDLY